MAEETENTATPATDEAPPATNGKSKPERKPREEGPPIEELFDLTKPIPKVSPWTDFAGCPCLCLEQARLVVCPTRRTIFAAAAAAAAACSLPCSF